MELPAPHHNERIEFIKILSNLIPEAETMANAAAKCYSEDSKALHDKLTLAILKENINFQIGTLKKRYKIKTLKRKKEIKKEANI